MERQIIAQGRERTIAGTPEQVRARLMALADGYGVDELVVVTMTYDFAARKRSYALLAEAFDLTAREAAA